MKVPQEQNKTFYSTPPLFLNIDFTTTEKKKKTKMKQYRIQIWTTTPKPTVLTIKLFTVGITFYSMQWI